MGTSIRPHLSFPEDTITTRLGRLRLAVTEAAHLHADANANALGDETVGLTLRGVRYAVSAHLYRWADGDLHIGRENQDVYSRWQALYISRVKGQYDNVSEAARRDIAVLVEAEVNAWAKSHPRFFVAGELAHLNNAIAGTTSEIDELDRKRAALTAWRDALISRELDVTRNGTRAVVNVAYREEVARADYVRDYQPDGPADAV